MPVIVITRMDEADLDESILKDRFNFFNPELLFTKFDIDRQGALFCYDGQLYSTGIEVAPFRK